MDNVWFNFLVYHPPPGLHVGKKNTSGDVPVVGTVDSVDGTWVRKGFRTDVPGFGTVDSGDGSWVRKGFRSDLPGVGRVDSGDTPTIPGGGWDTKKLNQT